MDTVGTKFVTYRYSYNGDDNQMPFLSKSKWLELAEEDMYFDETETYDLIASDTAIDKIAGNPWRGIYIRYKTKAPRGYIHASEYAMAKFGADELDYVDKSHKILRAWWD